MVSRITHPTFDCSNPYLLAGFWAQVLGFSDDPENPNEPGDEEAYIVAPDDSSSLLFIRVPEGKTVKNRVHLDIAPQDRTRDEEIDRLIGLGATFLADHRNPDGTGWGVLADPEGNEFCVERSDGERAAAGG